MDTSKLNFASLKGKVESKLKESSKPKASKAASKDKPLKNTKSKKDNNTTVKDNGKVNKNQSKNALSNKKDFKNQTAKKSQERESGRKADLGESMEDIVRREALALGADEEDLKMLEEVSEGEESEIEFGASNEKLDSSFGQDLSKFMKDIGLGNGEAVVVSDDDVPELVEDEGSEESESSEQEAEEEEDDEDEEEEDVEEDVEEEEDNTTKVRETQLDFNKPKVEEQKKDRLESVASVTTDKLIIEARIDWYNINLNLPPAENLSPQQVARLVELGKEALEQENKTYYEEFSKSSSQKKFLSEILTSGTLNDKISALTLLIQEAPVHNMKAFENLLGMCSKKSRTAALQSINALKDLFVNGLLPERKLVTFTKQTVLSNLLTKKQLGLLYYEDFLKKSYFKFIGTLEILSHDPIVHVRMNVVNHLFDLLKAKPEQEANLLRLGVNKLGDIENKVSSKTSHQITLLEQQHPLMKKIIIDAVTDVIFKQNNDFHATYYSVLALNQTILTRKEDDVANSLIKTYFTLFEKLLIETDDKNVSELGKSDYNKTRTKRNFKKGKKGGKSVKSTKTETEKLEETNSKLFSAILTGLNRAFPFCSLSNEVFSIHLDALFKITHSTNFNTSVQALVLIYHITSSQKLNPDRFYRTLYESLLDQRLLISSKQGIYLNLLFKSLKEDTDSNRIASFVKRICQICLNWLNIGTISGMIYLLINLEKSIPSLRNLIITTPVDSLEGESEEVKQYDPRQRDPRYSHAETSSLWEINHFLDHYHPTVALYAESFLLGKDDVNKPDLGLYTLSHFLDKFVYKNAKQKSSTKGSSIMQPLAGAQNGSLLLKTNVEAGEVPVNTRDWLNVKLEDIKPEDVFFYKYFSTKQDKASKSLFDKSLNKKLNDDDEEEAGSDLDDDQVWNALVKSNPEVEGDDESDYENFDDELSDLDAADFSDEDDEENDVDIEGFDDELISDSDEEEFVDAKEENEDDEEEEEEVEEVEEEEVESADEKDSDEDEIFQGDAEDEFDSEEIELQAIDDSSDEETSKKRKSDTDNSKKSKKSKKSKFKDLPVFADADEYAKYLESDDEEF